MNALRNALEQHIAQNFEFNSHAARLEELRDQFSHSIALIPFDEPLQDCNCVIYALGFRMQNPSSLFGRFYANTDYLRSLIDQGYLVEVAAQPADGFLAVYYSGNKVEHVGIVRTAGRVVSKWGIGFLYEHREWEVPSSYGSSIRYFASIDPDYAFNLLEAFLGAKQCF